MTTFSYKSSLLASVLLFALYSSTVQATTTEGEAPQRPQSYTVQPGDTLWGIAERFYFAPWMWKEIWHANPAIRNPNHIYPGDTIYLATIDGRQQLRLARGSTVKLVPGMRSESITTEITAIPISVIHQFLSRPYVVERSELEQAPYIVAMEDERIIGGLDNRIYVRGVTGEPRERFAILRLGDEYRDYRSGEPLGSEGRWVGEAELIRSGDPATLRIRSAEREVLIGDRLLPIVDEGVSHVFYPQPPEVEMEGYIISVFGGVRRIGQYHIVVLDRGSEDQMEVGNVLQVNNKGATVRDSIASGLWEEVTLPDEAAATLMVFRVFPRISFGLVMRASSPLSIGDRVTNPEIIRY